MNTKIVYKTVYKMLEIANTKLNLEIYNKLKNFDCEIKNQILKNAFLSDLEKRPLCQDTGQVVVFLTIGQKVKLEGEFIYDVINKAVSDCYKDNFYRKSVVKDAIFDRSNTTTNTPCIIHTELDKKDKISILIGIKGGGAENMSRLRMMNPTSTIEDILSFAKEVVEEAKDNACPPMAVGIGVGGTAEVAAINAKKALFCGQEIELDLNNVFQAKIISSQTHIACMPVCINLNCHSLRHIKAEIKDNEAKIDYKNYAPNDVELEFDYKKINTNEIEKIKSLKTGDKILLSGKIYTARDMAHKRLLCAIDNNEKLPFNLDGAIIFYAGPCPKKDGEVIGPIGPTTSKRMDKFAPLLYEKGVVATIGKGERTIKNTGYVYFKATGGVANLYKACVKSAKTIAYEDLGAEAIVELEVDSMPLIVEII